MCCILCEEPVRSIAFGLAAIGIVAVVNGARKVLAPRASARRETWADDVPGAVATAPVDAAR